MGTLALGLLVGAGLAPAARAEPALPEAGSCRRCNVAIVSIDTLRPDRLGTYGYPRGTSPELDALAARGVVFERAYSTSLATTEAHMSLFTSLYPSVHDVRSLTSDSQRPRRLPDAIPTLAEQLRAQGFATGGFHDGGNVNAGFGFDRGFDVYRRAPFVHGRGRKAVRDWLADVGERPFFLFLHSYHVHDPYMPGPAAKERFAGDYDGAILSESGALTREARVVCERDPDCNRFGLAHRLYWERVDRQSEADQRHLSDLYDAEIHEIDQVIPRVLEILEALPGDTLLVVLSDHGEAFGEHGAMGHVTLHEEVVRIPLLVVHPRAPEWRGRRSAGPVSLLNVAPWLLHWLGVDAPDSFQGRVAGAGPEVLTEYPAANHLALRRGGYKLLLEGTGGPLEAERSKLLERLAAEAGVAGAGRFQRIQLFDLAADPGETRDLGPAHPAFAPLLEAALGRIAANDRHREGLAVGPAAAEAPEALPAGTLDQLRALGYVD